MDKLTHANLVRSARLEIKGRREGAPTVEGAWRSGHDQGELDQVYGPSARARRKRKVTQGNQTMWARRYRSGWHSPDEVFGWDNPRRRKVTGNEE